MGLGFHKSKTKKHKKDSGVKMDSIQKQKVVLDISSKLFSEILLQMRKDATYGKLTELDTKEIADQCIDDALVFLGMFKELMFMD